MDLHSSAHHVEISQSLNKNSLLTIWGDRAAWPHGPHGVFLTDLSQISACLAADFWVT
jgi:hypothetical protein